MSYSKKNTEIIFIHFALILSLYLYWIQRLNKALDKLLSVRSTKTLENRSASQVLKHARKLLFRIIIKKKTEEKNNMHPYLRLD